MSLLASSNRLRTVLAFLAAFLTVASAQTACNGHAEFCSRQYSNVSVIGTHNSYAFQAGNIGSNQNYSITTQLDDGVRMLQVQGHMNNNTLHLCHTTCYILDGGSFTSYLSKVKTWLDANPNEVLTILAVNTDGILPTVWAQSYTEAGMDSYVYTPPSSTMGYNDWPTLQSMISSGRRVVNFLAQNADTSSVPYLLDEFSNIWETPYSVTDQSFPCTVDRGSSGTMYLMNHYLDRNITLLGDSFPVPDTARAGETNAVSGYGSLGTQADTCLAQHGYLPTFTLVDYYDVGDGSVFQYAANLNGVTYTPVEIGNGTAAAATSSSGGQNPAATSTPLNGGAAAHRTPAVAALLLGATASFFAL